MGLLGGGIFRCLAWLSVCGCRTNLKRGGLLLWGLIMYGDGEWFLHLFYVLAGTLDVDIAFHML